MKKSFNYFKKNPMLLVFIVVLLVYTPFALFSQGQSNFCAIVTAIGVDKIDDEFEVSLLTFIPTPNQTYLETSAVISGKGDSVAKAIANAGLTIGKQVCLSHAKTTVISTKLLEQDISHDIDYLGRVASLSENTILICTDESAKDFLKASQTLEKDTGRSLEQLINYNIQSIYVADTSLEAFFDGYYSPTSSSFIGYLSLGEGQEGEGGEGAKKSAGSGDSSNGGGGSSGSESPDEVSDSESGYSSSQSSSSSGGAGGGGGSSVQKKVLNSGKVVLVKNGKMVAKLDSDQLQGINIINGKAVNRVITVSDVSGEGFENATLTYVVKNKRLSVNSKFQNGRPIYCVNLVLGLELVEGKVNEENISTNTDLTDIPPSVKLKIENEVRKTFADSLKLLRENKTDVIGVTQRLERDNRKEYKKFLESLDDPDDILNHINFQLIVRVQPD